MMILPLTPHYLELRNQARDYLQLPEARSHGQVIAAVLKDWAEEIEDNNPGTVRQEWLERYIINTRAPIEPPDMTNTYASVTTMGHLTRIAQALEAHNERGERPNVPYLKHKSSYNQVMIVLLALERFVEKINVRSAEKRA
jgi:hypothetical protein